MLHAQAQQAGGGVRGEPFEARTQRVMGERSAARRERLLEFLMNPVIVPEDVEALNSQANSIYLAFKPRNGWQDWLTSEIAVIMVRVNRCSRIERRMREYAAYRAIDFWEDDQRVEVETLALKIHRFPGKTVAKLRLTPVGCDWLLSRWRHLSQTNPTDWTEDQRNLAASLTGGDPSIDPTGPGFAAAMVQELESRRERVVEADDIARTMVEADLSDHIPNLPSLRRYQRSLHRQMKYYIDQFHVEHPERWDDPNRKPAFIAQACIDRERERARTWSFAEPEPVLNATNPTPVAAMTPSPAADETKPTPPAPAPRSGETKPSFPPIERESDRTKPLEPVGTLAASLEAAFLTPEGLVVEQPEKVVERPRQVDRVRDANQRHKLARRRESLAKLQGV